MFAIVAAGRLPQAQPVQVDQTHIVFPIEAAESVNHLAVFMDGSQAFPPGYAATVHFLWPGQNTQWMLLGCLTNEKPSAIFKLRGPSTASSSAAGGSGGSRFTGAGDAINLQGGTTAGIGISVEPVQQVEQQIAQLPKPPASASAPTGIPSSALVRPGSDQQRLADASLLAPKIAENAYNYLTSFAPDSAPQALPILSKWLEGFQQKLKARGIGFLTDQ